ncbi:prestin-like [Diabrotica virgifera virgifera]|uniref:STAS domain-containing protein n=3 Tax=Diabrotica virgifera virgifera TaxID=50390 RepID=A0ABM5JTL7_DIAVI|nr:prestin-like [Diabrotica virgifera virgifera]
MKKTYTVRKNAGKVSTVVNRPVYELDTLNKDFEYEMPHKTIKERCVEAWERMNYIECLKRTFPIVVWIREYHWKYDLIADTISGITMAVLHIPQGMGFAMLGNVPPVIGIYMGIFPVLIYFILGTSRHVNQGTFAVTCLMTGKVVSHHATVHIKEVKDAYEPEEPAEYTNIQIGAAVTFVVAFMEIIMYVCRFGVTASLLSESLVSGFTCGAAFHVVNSQLRDILGVPIDKHFGAFSIPLTLYDIARNIHKSNYIAVIMSILTFAALILNHIFLKRRWRKLTRIPLPIELILILLGILAIDVIHLERDYDVTVVGRIPKGFPKPSVPPVSIMGSIIVDCIFISLVSYISNMSMALIFSRQFMYEIDANQELLALGASNVLGSFLSCLPMCVSLSRSVIQVTSGGVTQIVSVVSALLLIFVLLWFAPFFETLPRCVLASIIVESLKGLIFQVAHIPRFWRLSKWDAMVWLVTFLVTFFISIIYGLMAGIIAAIFSLFMQGYHTHTCVLGLVPNTDLYLDIERYKTAQEIAGIKMFHISGGLSFSSRFFFNDTLIKTTGIDPTKIFKRKLWLEKHGLPPEEQEFEYQWIVVDLTRVTFIDPSAVESLRSLQEDYAKLGITILLVIISGTVFETFVRCDKVEKKEPIFMIFPTVHDAVLHALGTGILNRPATEPFKREEEVKLGR